MDYEKSRIQDYDWEYQEVLMIEVRDVVTSVLYGLGENANRKHSDPEIIDALNIVLRYVNLALINAKSFWITKEVKLKPRNGKANLPNDFGGFKSFEDDFDGKYKFVGNTIKIDKEATMAYTYILDPIENIDDEIDLPYVLFDMFSRYSLGLLNGNFGADTVAGLISAEIQKMVAGESSGPIERPMPFFV